MEENGGKGEGLDVEDGGAYAEGLGVRREHVSAPGWGLSAQLGSACGLMMQLRVVQHLLLWVHAAQAALITEAG